MADAPPPAPSKGKLTSYLMVDGADKAAAFYEKAFGAQQVERMPLPDGRTMHLHLYINDTSLMLTDPLPEHGFPFEGHKGNTLHLTVEDVDAAYRQAMDAGAISRQAPHDAFWGDRYAAITDPFQVPWAFVGPKK